MCASNIIGSYFYLITFGSFCFPVLLNLVLQKQVFWCQLIYEIKLNTNTFFTILKCYKIKWPNNELIS